MTSVQGRARRARLLLKGAVWVAGLFPIAYLAIRFFLRDGLGANPIEELQNLTGLFTLSFLLATLTVTPLRRMTGWNDLARIRRPIGLFTYFYACIHFLVYIVLDQFFGWSFIIEDILERPYILAGFSALLILTALALTSTKGWIRRLKRNWTRLHSLVYIAAGLGVLHFYWKVKADTLWPLLNAGILLVLLTVRVVFWIRGRGVSPSRT